MSTETSQSTPAPAPAGAAGFTVTTTSELAPTLGKAIATVRAGQTAVVNVFLTR